MSSSLCVSPEFWGFMMSIVTDKLSSKAASFTTPAFCGWSIAKEIFIFQIKSHHLPVCTASVVTWFTMNRILRLVWIYCETWKGICVMQLSLGWLHMQCVNQGISLCRWDKKKTFYCSLLLYFQAYSPKHEQTKSGSTNQTYNCIGFKMW